MPKTYAEQQTLIQPSWLRDPNGFDGIHAGKGDTKDSLVERVKYAATARFTTRAPSDGLQWIGDERGIARGQGETDAAYGLRLQHAWDSWPYAGTAYGLLNALKYAGYTVALAQRRANAYTLDTAGNLVISSYGATYPYWLSTAYGTSAPWSVFTVIFLQPFPPSWWNGTSTQTYAASAGAASSFGLGNWSFGGTFTADTRIRIVCTTAGQPSSATFSISIDNGTTWTTGRTFAQVQAIVATTGATLTLVSNTATCAQGDILYVQNTFSIPADGGTEASFVKSIVNTWKPVSTSVTRYIITTAGRMLGWPTGKTMGTTTGPGVVVRLGGGLQTIWGP